MVFDLFIQFWRLSTIHNITNTHHSISNFQTHYANTSHHPSIWDSSELVTVSAGILGTNTVLCFLREISEFWKAEMEVNLEKFSPSWCVTLPSSINQISQITVVCSIVQDSIPTNVTFDQHCCTYFQLLTLKILHLASKVSQTLNF